MDNSIQIFVSLKHMGNISSRVREIPFLLADKPHTFSDFIVEAVKACVNSYKSRAILSQNPSPFSDEQFENMREIGKFAFGVHYNENEVDLYEAINTALNAVSDGLVRVFNNNVELTELDTEIEISEGDVFTFVKLTMLSGRMW